MDERAIADDLDASVEELGPEQGGGPPAALPWTLVVEEEEWSADLEHGAPLPSVDDQIEYITGRGERRLFRVTRIVHTVQRSASERRSVRHDDPGPNTLVGSDEGAEGEEPSPPRALRAGLPRVFVTRAD